MARSVLVSFGLSAVPYRPRRARLVIVGFGPHRRITGQVSWPRSLAGWL